jgi:hypothetical protein
MLCNQDTLGAWEPIDTASTMLACVRLQPTWICDAPLNMHMQPASIRCHHTVLLCSNRMRGQGATIPAWPHRAAAHPHNSHIHMPCMHARTQSGKGLISVGRGWRQHTAAAGRWTPNSSLTPAVASKCACLFIWLKREDTHLAHTHCSLCSGNSKGQVGHTHTHACTDAVPNRRCACAVSDRHSKAHAGAKPETTL